MKGYHVYAWLWNTITIEKGEERIVKEIYRRLQKKLLLGLHYATLDPMSIGDIKRLARVPYTRHQESGNRCRPVSQTMASMNPAAIDLDTYSQNGIDELFFRKVIKEVQEVKNTKLLRRPRERVSFTGIRDLVRKMIDRALQGEQLGHRQRLAIACELIVNNWRDEEIRDVFKLQDDFNISTTLYMVRHAKLKKYRSFKTETLKSIVNENR
jgi:hypothetical protein